MEYRSFDAGLSLVAVWGESDYGPCCGRLFDFRFISLVDFPLYVAIRREGGREEESPARSPFFLLSDPFPATAAIVAEFCKRSS